MIDVLLQCEHPVSQVLSQILQNLQLAVLFHSSMANVTVATSTFYIVWHKPFLKRGRANVSYIIYVYMSAEDTGKC